jgi:hypothetical protein
MGSSAARDGDRVKERTGGGVQRLDWQWGCSTVGSTWNPTHNQLRRLRIRDQRCFLGVEGG